MNKAELRAITLIVKKLGWNDMPATVAIPAIQRMINNDIAVGADCCGVVEDREDSLLSIATWSSDVIWMKLFVSDYYSLHDEVLEHWAITYRSLLESIMKKGFSFEEACNHYMVPSKEWEWEQYQESLLEQQIAYEDTIASLKYCY